MYSVTTTAPVTITRIGDLNLTEPGSPNHRSAEWIVNEPNTAVRPDHVQFAGDKVPDRTERRFKFFNRLRGRLKVPHPVPIGDDDVHGDRQARCSAGS